MKNRIFLNGCDTLVALKDATENKCVIFGKNSDRPYDEAQNLVHIPRQKHSKEQVRCTHISIPQVAETYEIFICQPYWMFGAEMGVNEFGVCIGNEAVWTIEPYEQTGLLGMDLLRLGLERGKDAKECMMKIIDLLEKYGQGGYCSEDGSMNYHNSFLIADSKEAWVLETAGDWWVAEHIESGVRSISNSLSIRNKGDLRKDGIMDYALENNLIKNKKDFDFAKIFSQGKISDEPSSFSREGRAIKLLETNAGKIDEKMMMNFLRDHKGGICMHGGFTSTASQVSRIIKDKFSINWFTGASNPCLNFYKPYILPYDGSKTVKTGPYNSIDPGWNWSKFRKLKTSLTRLDIKNKQKYYNRIDHIENELIKEVNKLIEETEDFNSHDFLDKMHKITQESWISFEKLSNEYIK
ncbi:MAG: peptidase C69 [Candidatus Lokiarchaeota archaeon]|nr:peptidase C69 [Candidatus Lokiarchaeota archaeon]